MLIRLYFIPLLFLSLHSCSSGQDIKPVKIAYSSIKTGAERFIENVSDSMKNERIAIVANSSSRVRNTHLVDTLLALGFSIEKIFSPEHGFRGKVEAGALIQDGIDEKTGLKIISLYGNHKKPTKTDLENIDLLLFDLQDVGVRFYTYISTLTYVMEACAIYDIPVVVLDRPNPNGFYVDGPVLDTSFSSFVGIHRVPVVYGMTIGEYAQMVNNEGWISEKCQLTVVPLQHYLHQYTFELPVKPSPNLPNWQSVYLYPSLCLFEGTIMSEGRGTDFPFQAYGHPDLHSGSFSFTPRAIPGVSENPKLEGKQCIGQNLTGYANNFNLYKDHFNLNWLISSYNMLSDRYEFFTEYFNLLAGTDLLMKQIKEGLTEEEIRQTWQSDLENFRKIRERYLLYD